MSDIVWCVVLVLACVVIYKVAYRDGHRHGTKEGWAKRERYGNGGRRQWQNKKPGRVKGTERGHWWNYFGN